MTDAHRITIDREPMSDAEIDAQVEKNVRDAGRGFPLDAGDHVIPTSLAEYVAHLDVSEYCSIHDRDPVEVIEGILVEARRRLTRAIKAVRNDEIPPPYERGFGYAVRVDNLLDAAAEKHNAAAAAERQAKLDRYCAWHDTEEWRAKRRQFFRDRHPHPDESHAR